MDHNYPELNPVVILRLSYLEPKEEVLGVIYLRKESVERFKSNVKEVLGDKFVLDELNREAFDVYLQKSKPITSIKSDVCFMFIPFVFNETSWEFMRKLQCSEYSNIKNAANAKELFVNVEFDTMTTLQLKGELVEHEINIMGDEMTVEDVTINPKEKLVEINLFSHTNDVLGTLWCYERSKERYESELKMRTSSTHLLVSEPLSLSTYEIAPDQGVFTHRCTNNPAIFIASHFTTPPFPMEINTVNVPTIGSVRKLLEELSGNVKLNAITVKSEPIVDVEEDLKTVEKILAKYELKLTAEQKCKFLEELVKVLG